MGSWFLSGGPPRALDSPGQTVYPIGQGDGQLREKASVLLPPTSRAPVP